MVCEFTSFSLLFIDTLIIMMHAAGQECQCRKFQSRYQATTSYLGLQGLLGGFLLIPARLFFEVLPTLFQHLCFSSSPPVSLRSNTQRSDNIRDIFHTLHLPQLFHLNCQIQILVDLFLLFDVYASVTGACITNGEAILVLFVYKHVFKAVMIQLLVIILNFLGDMFIQFFSPF